MKNLSRLLLTFTLAAPSVPAALAATACPACCQVEKPVAAPGFSGRSIYQLDATWTNDSGAAVQLGDLRGRPVVLTMFFSSCGNACPVLVADMQRIQASLPESVRNRARFVLVSFDDRIDTAGVLHAYRERVGLNGQSWVLLHGAPGDIQELAAALGVQFKRTADGYYEHSNLITILNADGEIAYQRPGLAGNISETVQAITAIAAK